MLSLKFMWVISLISNSIVNFPVNAHVTTRYGHHVRAEQSVLLVEQTINKLKYLLDTIFHCYVLHAQICLIPGSQS